MTTSPVAACSARIIRSIALAFSASTTLPKSLTGAVSSGSAADGFGWAPALPVLISASSTAAATTSHERRTPSGERLTCIRPAVDVAHNPGHRLEIRREQSLALCRWDVVRTTEFDDLTNGTVPGAQHPFDVPCRRRAGIGRVPFEPREARDQRGECRRRLHDQNGGRIGAAVRFEKSLAQVEQVAAGLHLAGAAKVGGIDGQRGKRVCSRDQAVVREN